MFTFLPPGLAERHEYHSGHEILVRWDFWRCLWIAECRDCEQITRADFSDDFDVQYSEVCSWVHKHLEAAIYQDWLVTEVDKGRIHVKFIHSER